MTRRLLPWDASPFPPAPLLAAPFLREALRAFAPPAAEPVLAATLSPSHPAGRSATTAAQEATAAGPQAAECTAICYPQSLCCNSPRGHLCSRNLSDAFSQAD